VSSKIWNVGCTLILGGSSNLYTSLNTHSTIGNGLANLDMNFEVRPLGLILLMGATVMVTTTFLESFSKVLLKCKLLNNCSV
jgi:hypothetical protein